MRDVLTGRITLRKFRMMVDNLPPGNVLERARHGRWGDTELLLYAIESRLRELYAITFNANRAEGASPIETVTYLDRPLTAAEAAAREAQQAYDDLMEQQLRDL